MKNYLGKFKNPKFSIFVVCLFAIFFALTGTYIYQNSKAWTYIKAIPKVVVPFDGNIVTTKRPQIAWTAVSGANAYRLWLYKDDTLLSVPLVTGTAYTPSFDLENGGNYYWKVQGVVKSSTGEITGGSPISMWHNFSIDTTRTSEYKMPSPAYKWTGAFVPGTATDFSTFEQNSGKDQQVAVKFKSFYWDQHFPAAEAKSYYDKNAHYLLTWEMWQGEKNTAYQPQFYNSKVTSNQYFTNAYGQQVRFDDYIATWAKEIKEYKKPVYLRFGHEMNGGWYPWGAVPNSGNTPATYVAMWKHVHNIFEQNGVKNVHWVWNANNSPTSTMKSYYPGDNYVDIVSLDGYNWGETKSWSDWTGFSALFTNAYNTVTAFTQRSIWIVEMGSVEGGTNVGSKAVWIKNAYNYANVYYPKVRAIMWFNQDEWKVNTSSSALESFKTYSPVFK